MFPSRPKIFTDESLESYLLRLASVNSYSTKQLFRIYFNQISQSNRTRYLLPKTATINIIHSKSTSKERLLFLKAISDESNTDIKKIYASTTFLGFDRTSNDLVTYLCRGLQIPALFYREKFVPICPICLSEKNYIRLAWHIGLTWCCSAHKAQLIHYCPKCNEQLSYLNNEDVLHCRCGFDLSKAKPPNQKPSRTLLNISDMINSYFLTTDLKNEKTTITIKENSFKLHTIISIALFYYKQIKSMKHTSSKDISAQSFNDFLHFIKSWPHSYHEYLKNLSRLGLETLIKPPYLTAFSAVYGTLLSSIQNLPDNTFENNHILKETFLFLQQTLADNCIYHAASCLLLTKQEAALLLGTTTNHIAKLVHEGFLSPHKKSLKAYIPAYPLNEVLNLWLTHFQNKNSNMFYYLSRI